MNKTALRIVLGVSFFFIMLVSVTHVAWAAHEMEGGPADTSTWDWIMSYIFALAIDVAIASISLFLTTKKGLGYKVIGYSFVIGLTLLSWFANWTYNKEHMVTTGVWAGTIHVADHQVSMSWLAPIAFGALPVIGIAFSVMIDFFTAEKVTVAELEAFYQEKAAMEQIKEKYVKKGALKEKLNRLVDDATEVTSHAKSAAVNVLGTDKKSDSEATEVSQKTDKKQTLFGRFKRKNSNTNQTTPEQVVDEMADKNPTTLVEVEEKNQDTNQTEDGQTPERITDKLPIANLTQTEQKTDERLQDFSELADENQTTPGQSADNNSDNISDESPTQASGIDRSRKPIYITLSDAIVLSGYTSEYLSRLVSLGKVQAKKSDKKILLRKSLDSYILTHKPKSGEELKDKNQTTLTKVEAENLDEIQTTPEQVVDENTDTNQATFVEVEAAHLENEMTMLEEVFV